MNDEMMDGWTEAPRPDAPAAVPRRGRRMRRGAVAATVAGLAAGGLGGALAVAHITGSGVVAATFQATTAAGSGASTAPGGATGAPSGASGSADPGHGPGGGPGGPGGLQTEDAAVVAGVIGITPAQLTTALQGGSTIAQVAKAHNVAVDKVISVWVASEEAEVDARVKSGQITQAEGVQQKSMTTQRITDEVNGTGHGPGGPGGHGGPGGPPPSGSGAPPSGSGSGSGA